MNCCMIILCALLSVQKFFAWVIPYSLEVDWNRGQKTYLLIGSKYTGPFGVFDNLESFKNKTGKKLTIKQGQQEVFDGYSFINVSYQDASTLANVSKFVWVNEKDILRGFKKRGNNPQQIIDFSVVSLFEAMRAKESLVSGLYTSDGVRKSWGAASNGTWDFFKDTIYANKPDTKGFEKYYCFMNTYPDGAVGKAYVGPAPITLGLYYDKGIIADPVRTWRHAEAYYQAMKKVYPNKTYDKAGLNQVLVWDSHGEIMNIYNAYKGRIGGLRSDWQMINLYIMFDLVRAKFMQNKNIRDILVSTGDKYIVEETSSRSDKAKDSFFGNAVGYYDSNSGRWITDPNKQPGMGSNILGQILMHVREELKAGTLLPLTLYAEPEDFFRKQKTGPFQPKGTSWRYVPSGSALQKQDIPLLGSLHQQSDDTLMEILTNLDRTLRQLIQTMI